MSDRPVLRVSTADMGTGAYGSRPAAGRAADPYNSPIHSGSLRESLSGGNLGSPARAAKERHAAMAAGSLRSSQELRSRCGGGHRGSSKRLLQRCVHEPGMCPGQRLALRRPPHSACCACGTTFAALLLCDRTPPDP